MAKTDPFNPQLPLSKEIPTYIGWYQPHEPVNWTGEILDPKTGELVKEPSLTKQSEAWGCDINNIVRQFTETGIYTHVNQRAALGQYLDLPGGFEYQDALNVIVAGEAAFDSLPSSVRERFANNPANFLAFLQDPDNQDEAIRMGLATRKEPPEAEPRPPSPPAPPTGGSENGGGAS